MGFLEDMAQRAAVGGALRVAFPESDNAAMLHAAAELARRGVAAPVLVGQKGEAEAAASAAGVDLAAFAFAPEEAPETLVDRCFDGTAGIMGRKSLARRAGDPLWRALMLEAAGDVDLVFAGIDYSTGDVIMAAQGVLGLAEGIVTPSSVAVFDIPGFEGSEGSLLAFGDSAVCQEPNAEQTASIAISCCDSAAALLGWEPRCALLSYSSDGSAHGTSPEKQAEARRIANELRPDLAIDGEFQLDAALRPDVAAKKVRRASEVAGRANVLVWPDLDVGNIAVKSVQLFAGGRAYGPFLQGFAKPVCDCSRGASVEEIVGNCAAACVMAKGMSA
ncbi:MAG: phosphate acyltransferase [Eggerthellaceae bacterium]|nr:phosphate acyltransferase [Eggerthellaceae bacterium]